MSIVNKIMSLIFIALITSCNTHKKNIINDINNNDDYKIINLLFNKYSDTVFYNDAKTLFIVYEDSMMLNNRFRTTKEDKQKNVDEVFYKYIDKNKIQNKKFVVVSNDEYNYKIDYPKTPFNSKPDKHKFVIKELYYNDTKTEAFLNYCEVVYTPIYGTVWNNTCYEMRYKKENGKWIELGNFNRKLN